MKGNDYYILSIIFQIMVIFSDVWDWLKFFIVLDYCIYSSYHYNIVLYFFFLLCNQQNNGITLL